jgi:hypothetical protein
MAVLPVTRISVDLHSASEAEDGCDGNGWLQREQAILYAGALVCGACQHCCLTSDDITTMLLICEEPNCSAAHATHACALERRAWHLTITTEEPWRAGAHLSDAVAAAAAARRAERLLGSLSMFVFAVVSLS